MFCASYRLIVIDRRKMDTTLKTLASEFNAAPPQPGVKSIPYGHQAITEEDIAAVAEVLRGDWLTQGPVVSAFETAVADLCGARFAVAVNSATSALHLACLALEVGQGDLVWTASNSFVASANCALYCNADVDFVDIDPNTFCMSAEALADKLSTCRAQGLPLPKAVIPVHFGGQSCDMAAISLLAETYGFKVIEDASHAIGGQYQSAPIGGCQFSDVTVFSFHPVKIITTGEGGMALTNNESLHRAMQRLRSHGITRVPDEMIERHAPAWHYEQHQLGFNYRMSDLQAALGLSQLRRLSFFVEKRQSIAIRYDEKLASSFLSPQQIPAWTTSSRHLYVLQVVDVDRDNLIQSLRSHGIQATLHYPAIHLQPYFKNKGFRDGYLPNTEKHGSNAITLPLYPGLSEPDQDWVIENVKDIISRG